MPTAERPLVWCPQCANCRFENNTPYCKSNVGKWVELPAAVLAQPGYCQRYKQKEGKND